MNQMEFMSAAQKVGVGSHLSALFLVAPDQLGTRLLDAAKRLARFLKDATPELGHRKRLEVVAKGAGFPNWHAFQTLCQHFVDHYAPPQVGARPPVKADIFEPLVGALPLLVVIGADTAPVKDSIAGLEVLGRRLATALNAQLPPVMDTIARLYGADTWSILCNRKPEDSDAPLYVFSGDAHGGEFIWSPACAALVEEMDELWQDYGELSKADQNRARRYVKAIVKKRPDFLEGCLALATITELDGAPEHAGPILEEAIRRADCMIPSSFHGEISWYHVNNRFYHRLLFARMRWCAAFGLLGEAIELARRQLRLNKDDNLGVRISLPALLAANGDHEAAKLALLRISHPEVGQDGHILLVRSLCHLAAGDMSEGKALFLRALFEFPAIRPLILDGEVPDIHGTPEKWHRGVIPDVEMLWFDYCTVSEQYPTQTEDVFIKLLLHPDVIASEKDLAVVYIADRKEIQNSGRYPPMARWENRVLEASRSLAIRLL